MSMHSFIHVCVHVCWLNVCICMIIHADTCLYVLIVVYYMCVYMFTLMYMHMLGYKYKNICVYISTHLSVYVCLCLCFYMQVTAMYIIADKYERERIARTQEQVNICMRAFVHVYVCIYMDPCICVCLLKKHVFMRGMFLSAECSMKGITLFSSFPTFLGYDSTQRAGGQNWPSQFSPEPWHLSPVYGCFSPRASVSLSVKHGCWEKKHEAVPAFSLHCSVLGPLFPLCWGGAGRVEKNLSFPQDYCSIRSQGICCQKNLCKWSDRLMLSGMFDCEARHGCAGQGGCFDAELLHKEHTFSPASYTSLSLPCHIFFLAALSLLWWSGDRNDSDQWPSWFRENWTLHKHYCKLLLWMDIPVGK